MKTYYCACCNNEIFTFDNVLVVCKCGNQMIKQKNGRSVKKNIIPKEIKVKKK